MSHTFGYLTLYRALMEGQLYAERGCPERFDSKGMSLPLEPAWEPINQEQADLIQRWPEMATWVRQTPWLLAWLRKSAAEINTLAAQHGLDIRLEGWSDPDSVGILSVNSFEFVWLAEGKVSRINNWASFDMGENNGLKIYKTRALPSPLISLPTTDGKWVFISRLDASALDEGHFAVLDKVKEVRSYRAEPIGFYEKARIPMLDMDALPDISWVCGMTLGEWYIAQALQQLKLKMNQKGGKVVEGTMMQMRKGISPILEIDGSFLMWIEKSNVPVFAGLITPEDFKNPGSIDFGGAKRSV